MIALAGAIILFGPGRLSAQEREEAPAPSPDSAPLDRQVRELMERLDSSDMSLCFKAVGELAALGPDALPFVWKLLEGAGADSQRYLITAIGRMNSAAAMKEALRKFDGFDPSVRPMLVSVVTRFRDKTTVRVLRDMLATDEAALKYVVFDALLKMKDDRVVEDLVDIFCRNVKDDEELPEASESSESPELVRRRRELAEKRLKERREQEELRLFAFRRLLVLARADGLPSPLADELIANLRYADEQQTVRTIHLLAYIKGNVTVLREIEELLDAREEKVRAAAAYAIGNLGSRATDTLLIERLAEEPDGPVQRKLIDALARLGCEASVPHLIPLLDSRDRELVVTTWEALKTLTGKSLPCNYQQWVEWWDSVVTDGQPVAPEGQFAE